MASKRVKLYNLKNGMKIADDVYNRNAQLIIPKGIEVNEKVIERLTFHSILSVPILVDDPVTPSEQTEPKTHAQRIRESQAFYQYSEAFYEAKDTFQYELNDIADRNAQVDIDKMFETTAEIIKNADTSYQVFDMLHNMRNFDDSTYAHSLNVSIICNIMGKWLDMSEEDTKILTVAGLMHDVGKLLIPSEIITKPGKLTDEEYTTIKEHTKRGFELIARQGLDPRIAHAVLCHHEKCDGSGYPMGWPAKKIPPFAKIVCIVDIYEAMTADRVYRKGMCPFDVIRSFEAEGYQKYDPHYLLTFLKGIAQTYLHETVLLSNNERGEIIMLNDNTPSRPMIHTKDRFIDLSKEPELEIIQIL